MRGLDLFLKFMFIIAAVANCFNFKRVKTLIWWWHWLHLLANHSSIFKLTRPPV